MTTDTIAEQVSTMHAGMAAQPPSEVMGAFTREKADLAAQGIPSSVVATGASLPDASLLDAQGTPTTLYGVTGGRPAVVVVFYRGTWCPYCNLALSTYQAPAARGPGRAKCGFDCRKPPGARRIVEHAAEE
jgi:hypothetical protein